MFWKLSFLQPCAIDSLLDKEDCTLDEILDEDDVLQECKTNNKKLTDFLVQPAILEQLVRMVCFEPNEDVADKVKFKYPHLACEVLTCGVMSIVEQLATTPSLLEMLWAFLDTSEPLNPLLASFISKVLGMLLEKQQSVIVDYVRAKEDFLTKYLRHLGTSAIMDLLLRMVNGSPGSSAGRSNLSLWLEEERLIDRLVDFIKTDTDSEQCVNASLTLCEMIRLSREATQDTYQSSDPNQQDDSAPLHEKLEGKDMIERLLNNVFSTESPSNVLVVSGVSVLLVILTDNVFSESGMLESVMDPVPSDEKPPPPGIGNLLEIIVPWLTKFHALLKQAPEISRMNTTVGVLDPPLGNVRLQIVKLISALLSKATSAIAAEIVVLDLFSTLIDLFFTYPWNNFLHMQVELCVRSVLNSTHPLDSTTTANMSRPRDDLTAVDTDTETRSEVSEESQAALKSLTNYLLKDCQFVCKLLDGVSKNEELSRDSPCSRRQGYMGHLIRLSNTLVKFGEVSDQLTLSMDDPTRQRWNNYVNGPLAEMNKRNETNLGGNQAVSLNMDDSDEEFEQNPQDSELEKAYHQYLDLKYCTNYREDYGVEDELTAAEEPFEASFTRLMDITRVITADEEQTQASASLFEAACSDRIQQFDDEEESEDEEEEVLDDDSMWADKEANLASPMEHHSISSDDDDEFVSGREFPTGESYEGVSSKRSPPKKPPHPRGQGGGDYPIITQISSVTSSDPDKMEIESSFTGMWRDVSDKSGAASEDVPMENADWTKEPDAPKPMSDDQNADSNWADFSKFSSTFGANSIQTSSDDNREGSSEDYGVSSSHITVTYRANSHPEDDDEDDYLEPVKRPDTSKYDPLSPGKREDNTGEENSAMNFEDSYNSDDDDDGNSSSDSDEERAGSYNLNTTQGSEGEELINSLNDSREQEIATLSPAPTTPSSSVTVISQDPSSSSSSNGSDSQGESSLANRHDTADTNDSGTSTDTPSDDTELQDNYKFLSKGLMSHSGSEGSGGSNTEEIAVEQKRAEAHEACSVYTNEVSGTT